MVSTAEIQISENVLSLLGTLYVFQICLLIGFPIPCESISNLKADLNSKQAPWLTS